MAPHKVLFISSNFPPVIGGSSVVYDQICRKAAEFVIGMGSRINHETNEPLRGVAEHDADCGYIMYRIKYLRPPALSTAHTKAKFFSFIVNDIPVMARTLSYVTFLTFRHNIKTICIGELVYNGWLVFPLRYLLRRRVVLYTHGEEISQNGGHFFAKLRRGFLHHTHAVISVSLFCKSLIVSKYGVDPAKIFVIPNGVDLETFSRGPSDRTVFPPSIRNKKVLLTVSRLVERKGHKQLILAMPTVLSKNPEAHCVVVGDGPEGESLKYLVTQLRLESHVTFLGSVPLDELVRVYRASDIFVLPCQTLPNGDTEGFGLVFLEANACGLPVVAGAAGGTTEAVIDQETGLIVDGTDPAQIADAIARLLDEPSLAHRLSEAGWILAQECGWVHRATEFLKVCDNRPPHRKQHNTSYPLPVPAAVQMTTVAKVNAVVKPKLLMTVDVEEEFDWSKFSRSEYKIRGIEGLSAFHEDCRKIGVVPTYLLSPTIMDDSDYRRLFADLLAQGSAELGIHLHSWVTAPFWEHANEYNSFQCNLPAHIERRKLETLCRKYEDCFGKAVTVHRAGRWGGAERTSVLLEEMGIKVDLSPSAGYSSAKAGGPDFTNLSGHPFWSGKHKSVLTLPASAINYLPGPDWISRVFFASMETMPGIRSAASQGFGQAIRFSPEGHSTVFLKGMVRQLAKRNLPVVVCAIHSTSLYSGGNPYVGTDIRAAQLRKRTAEILRDCVDVLGFCPSTCVEIYDQALHIARQPSSSKFVTHAE